MRPAETAQLLGQSMNQFASDNEPAQPEQVGVFLCHYINSELLSSNPANDLRGLLSRDDVPAQKRDTFDDQLFLYLIFLTFVAARRKYPPPMAEQVLTGALNPLISKLSPSEVDALQASVERLRSACPAGESRGKELARLALYACFDLFGNNESAELMMAVTFWIHAHIKLFDNFMSKPDIAAT